MTLVLIAAFFAGLVDAMGGGGGLFTTPALLLSGVPLPLVLGTNKVIGTFGSLAAIFRFRRARLLSGHKTRNQWLRKTAIIVIAASGGAYVSTYKGITDHLNDILPPILLFILLILIKKWFFPSRSLKESTPDALNFKVTPSKGSYAPISLIGFYDGLFGPGTGIFFLSYLERLGYPTQIANAIAKIFNLASNVGALVFFAIFQKVDWRLGLLGAGCYLVGNFIGAGFVLKSGHKLIRVTVVIVTLLTIFKLLFTT